MKLLSFFLSLALLAGCSNDASFRKAEDAQDAGREFIRASLDGNFPKAEFYLHKDTVSLLVFNRWKTGFQKMTAEEKMNYMDANILPIEITNINDSVVSYTYSNSYKKIPTTLRVVKINGDWLVDLTELH
ncbi:MAG: DUF4878 domain-containing protein [Flavihumibacter sp.]